MDDLTDLRGFADLCKDLGNKAHITPGDSQYMRALWGAETRLKDCADIIEEQAALLREAEEVAIHVTAHLDTAVGLLERAAKVPKDGRAPSDAMFNRTLEGQKSAIDRARAFLTKLEARK